jgi:hypothetical protein
MSLHDDLLAYDASEETICVAAKLTDEQFREIERLLGYEPNWLGRHKGWSESYVFTPERSGRAERTLDYLRKLGIPHSYTLESHWRVRG